MQRSMLVSESLIFGTVILVVLNSSVGQKISPSQDLAIVYPEIRLKEDAANNDTEIAPVGASLQKRELITAGIIISSLVVANLKNMEPSVTALHEILQATQVMPQLLEPLKQVFGTLPANQLPNGGRLRRKDGSIYWRGTMLEFNTEGGVHVFVISPKKEQYIVVVHKRVFLNHDPICQNTDELGKPEYRTCSMKEEGKDEEVVSMWYTNLVVCVEMTEGEIDEFKDVQKQVQTEREQLFVPVLDAIELRLKNAGRLGKKVAGVPIELTLGLARAVAAAPGTVHAAALTSAKQAVDFAKGIAAIPGAVVDAAGAAADNLVKNVEQQRKRAFDFTKNAFGRAGPKEQTGVAAAVNTVLWGKQAAETPPRSGEISRLDSNASSSSSSSQKGGIAKFSGFLRGSSKRFDGWNRYILGKLPSFKSPSRSSSRSRSPDRSPKPPPSKSKSTSNWKKASYWKILP